MTAPAVAALRFLLGLAYGIALGVIYDFLRPLRRRHNAPADLMFVVCALILWTIYSFKVCQADIRISTTAAMGLGTLSWVLLLGRGIRGIFYLFWNCVFTIFGWICLPFKKIFEIFLFFYKKAIGFWEKKGYNIGKES